MPHAQEHASVPDGAIAVVGRGRVGRAVAAALASEGFDVRGPLGRGERADDAAIVLLAVPDAAITQAAAAVPPGRLVGHFSGATSVSALADHEGFSIHPLTAVTEATASFAGVPAAVAGATAKAQDVAEELARILGMVPFRIADDDRAAYHAAASIASNFLITVEAFAEDLAATAGIERAMLAPLVQNTVDNWRSHGARRALTGPIVRGDDATVQRQRAAVAERLPQRLALFDMLVAATRELAAEGAPAAKEGAA